MFRSLMAAGLLLTAGAAQAATFSFTGALSEDDEVQFFDFSVDIASDVVLRTWSYAGGVNAEGVTIAAGGFDPILAVFAVDGMQIGDNDDGFSSQVNADPVTGSFYDTFLEISLDPGTYSVGVSQFDNFAGATRDDPFDREGEGDFTAASCGGERFCDISNDVQRTGNWAFDILNVNQAAVVDPGGPVAPPPTSPSPVPLPASIPLLLAGLGALAVMRRRPS